jgi:hypothetical protein
MQDNTSLKCDRCGYEATTKGNLVRHLQSKRACHPQENDVDRAVQLRTLLYKDMTLASHVCQNCACRYKHASSLSKHKLVCKRRSALSSNEPQAVNASITDNNTSVATASEPYIQDDTPPISNEIVATNNQDVMGDQLNMFKSLCLHLQGQMKQLQQEITTLKHAPSNNSSVPPEHPHKIGYIYLIREREFVNSNQNVFKVGRTIQKTPTCYLERLKDYKRGSQMFSVLHVESEDCEHIETKVKEAFNKMFKRHNDGHEYFEGDPKTMSLVINSVYAKYYNAHLPSMCYM